MYVLSVVEDNGNTSIVGEYEKVPSLEEIKREHMNGETELDFILSNTENGAAKQFTVTQDVDVGEGLGAQLEGFFSAVGDILGGPDGDEDDDDDDDDEDEEEEEEEEEEEGE